MARSLQGLYLKNLGICGGILRKSSRMYVYLFFRAPSNKRGGMSFGKITAPREETMKAAKLDG
jgi:hypothetical protein